MQSVKWRSDSCTGAVMEEGRENKWLLIRRGEGMWSLNMDLKFKVVLSSVAWPSGLMGHWSHTGELKKHRAVDGHRPSEEPQVDAALPWQKLALKQGSALPIVVHWAFQVRIFLKGKEIMRSTCSFLTLLELNSRYWILGMLTDKRWVLHNKPEEALANSFFSEWRKNGSIYSVFHFVLIFMFCACLCSFSERVLGQWNRCPGDRGGGPGGVSRNA